MCLAHGPQRSDAGEAWTRGPSVSSQALYHWASSTSVGSDIYRISINRVDPDQAARKRAADLGLLGLRRCLYEVKG